MRKLREDEIEDLEGIRHLVKYTLLKKDIRDIEVYYCLKKLCDVSKTYLEQGNIDPEEINKIFDMDELNDVLEKFMNMIVEKIGK